MGQQDSCVCFATVRLGRALFESPYASMRDRWVERAYAVLKYRNMVLCQNEARRDENFN